MVDSPRVQTYDINTADVEDTTTTPPTPAGATYRPLRYTTSVRNEIRVGVWMVLATILGTYAMDVLLGLDVESIQDPAASDGEREAIVSDLVLTYPGVTAITKGPAIVFTDGILRSISLEALTTTGETIAVAA